MAQRVRAAALSAMLGMGLAAPSPTKGQTAGPVQVASLDTPRPAPRDAHPNFPRTLHTQVERNPAERRQAFLDHVAPIVATENRRIMAVRHDVERIAAKRHPSPQDHARLEQLAQEYRTEPTPTALLRSIDIVPPALVLAQAALESGWATSPLARRANALFGQKAFVGGPERYAAFDSLDASVASYMLNLNRHRSYAGFRRQREQMRRQGRSLDAAALAASLGSYSERGQDYVTHVRDMIRSNRLATR